MCVLKISQNSQEKTYVWVFFNIDAGPDPAAILKETPAQLFFSGFCKVRTPLYNCFCVNPSH